MYFVKCQAHALSIYAKNNHNLTKLQKYDKKSNETYTKWYAVVKTDV